MLRSLQDALLLENDNRAARWHLADMFSDVTLAALAVAIPLLMLASFVLGLTCGAFMELRPHEKEAKIVELAWNHGHMVRIT